MLLYVIILHMNILRRKKLAFSHFKKTIQHFAPLSKLIREMPLF